MPEVLNLETCALSGKTLIEASAGTGKTWNICGLYLRVLLELRLPVDRILVVTFTNAATAELRERIRQRLSEARNLLSSGRDLPSDEFVGRLLNNLTTEHGRTREELVASLDHALQLFDEAAILTIHSFCERALRDIPFAAGMPLALELLADDIPIIEEVARDFWRRNVAGPHLTSGLASELIAKEDSPESFARYLRQRLTKPLARIAWSDDPAPAQGLDTSAIDALHARAIELWRSDRNVIVTRVKLALPRLKANSYKDAAVDTAAASWDAYLAVPRAVDANERLDKLELLSWTMLSAQTKKNQSPPEQHEFYDVAATLLVEKRRIRLALIRARHDLLRHLLVSAPAKVREAKLRQRVIGFDDMLYNLYERLASDSFPDLAAQLRSRYPVTLIDEFQDTDPLQYGIFEAIYSGHDNPLFLVGDPKQAIYSFRNADLHVYLRARRTARATYTLASNQRASRALLAGLNALFERNPRAFQQEGLDYVELRYGDKPRTELADLTDAGAPFRLWTLPTAEHGVALRKKEARLAAGNACAAEVARLLRSAGSGNIRLGDRPLKAGDIAVLVPTHREGRLMRAALQTLGIGCVELSQTSIFATPEAREFAQVLAAVIEPGYLPRVRAALGTTLLGFDAAGIDALGNDEPLLVIWLTRLARWREEWLQNGVGSMLRRLLVEQSVAKRVLASVAGERRLTNVLHLVDVLHQASARQASPSSLLAWLLARIEEPDGDENTQLRLESDRNLVQIVTIHKSKGLEYPVVFCPFLWDGRRGPSGRGRQGLEYHDDEGNLVLDFRDLSPEERAPLTERRQREADAERLRLIYVALTRASHRCYVVVGTYGRRYRGSLSTAESGRSLLNWLVAGAASDPAEWSAVKLEPEDVTHAWTDFAASCPDSVTLAEIPGTVGAPFVSGDPPSPTLAALEAPARIPAGWWVGSYSSLAQGARKDDPAVDHDLRSVPADDPVFAPDASLQATADDILSFPRGAAAGDCIHALFESIDFTRPDGWPAAINTALRNFPTARVNPSLFPKLPAMLAQMLRDVLTTSLPFGIRLAEIPTARRLVELEFSLPAERIVDTRLTELVRSGGYEMPSLSFGRLDGYLRGFIDLICEWQGRYFILDWKSNYLGASPRDYAEEPVRSAMREHGYHLQHLLYTVATHRYLATRVAQYDYETHFGGVLYVFVRGVRPQWRLPDGTGIGVYSDRAPRSLIEAMSGHFSAARHRN